MERITRQEFDTLLRRCRVDWTRTRAVPSANPNHSPWPPSGVTCPWWMVTLKSGRVLLAARFEED